MKWFIFCGWSYIPIYIFKYKANIIKSSNLSITFKAYGIATQWLESEEIEIPTTTPKSVSQPSFSHHPYCMCQFLSMSSETNNVMSTSYDRFEENFISVLFPLIKDNGLFLHITFA